MYAGFSRARPGRGASCVKIAGRGYKFWPANEDTPAPDTSIRSSIEEAGLVSDGLLFDGYVALDDDVAIRRGSRN